MPVWQISSPQTKLLAISHSEIAGRPQRQTPVVGCLHLLRSVCLHGPIQQRKNGHGSGEGGGKSVIVGLVLVLGEPVSGLEEPDVGLEVVGGHAVERHERTHVLGLAC